MGRGWWFLLYLVAFFGAQILLAVGVYVVYPDVSEYSARGAAVLIALVYFAWAMPRTGRASWKALGLFVPILNAYLVFSTFWRLASQRAGVLSPSK